MHPPLYRPHPDCQEMIYALVDCHEVNKFSKFWGACNDAKANLDICFKAEKDRVRKENLKKAKEDNAKFEAILKSRQKPTDSS